MSAHVITYVQCSTVIVRSIRRTYPSASRRETAAALECRESRDRDRRGAPDIIPVGCLSSCVNRSACTVTGYQQFAKYMTVYFDLQESCFFTHVSTEQQPRLRRNATMYTVQYRTDERSESFCPHAVA